MKQTRGGFNNEWIDNFIDENSTLLAEQPKILNSQVDEYHYPLMVPSKQSYGMPEYDENNWSSGRHTFVQNCMCGICSVCLSVCFLTFICCCCCVILLLCSGLITGFVMSMIFVNCVTGNQSQIEVIDLKGETITHLVFDHYGTFFVTGTDDIFLINLTYTGKESHLPNYDFSIESSTATLTQKNVNGFNSYWGRICEAVVDITTTSRLYGNMVIQDLDDLKGLEITPSHGSVKISNVKVKGDFNYNSRAGENTLENIKVGGSADISIEDGDLSSGRLFVDGDCIFNQKYGDFQSHTLECEHFEATSKYGSFTLENSTIFGIMRMNMDDMKTKIDVLSIHEEFDFLGHRGDMELTHPKSPYSKEKGKDTSFQISGEHTEYSLRIYSEFYFGNQTVEFSLDGGKVKLHDHSGGKITLDKNSDDFKSGWVHKEEGSQIYNRILSIKSKDSVITMNVE